MNSSYPTHGWNQYGWFCAYRYTRGIFSLLVAALSVGVALAGAPPELPSTPAGKVLAGYLEALNSGNKDTGKLSGVRLLAKNGKAITSGAT